MTLLATGVTGYLGFYDERHRPASPLTSHTACDYLQAVMHEPSMPALWKAGRITGWMEALMENAPQTFKRFVFSERITALQTMYKKRDCRADRNTEPR
jgi:hypothetical protein